MWVPHRKFQSKQKMKKQHVGPVYADIYIYFILPTYISYMLCNKLHAVNLQ